MATRIYCPKCEWHPGPGDRWQCGPGCGMVWNTFETRGRCPRCAKQWTVTQCLVCLAVSPHEDWYHDEAPERAEDDAWREAVEEGEPVEVGAS
jgi:hypothetical protein